MTVLHEGKRGMKKLMIIANCINNGVSVGNMHVVFNTAGNNLFWLRNSSLDSLQVNIADKSSQ